MVRNGDVGHDFAVDWWSVGVLTYELLTGSSPFTFEGNINSQQEITDRILHSTPPVPKYAGRDIQDFIAKLLVKDPKKRLGRSMESIHEFYFAILSQIENVYRRKSLGTL